MSPNLVSSLPSKTLQERWAQLRSHKRVISKVKLLVEWEEGAAPRQANAVTVDISHSGCMAVVGADLPLHRRVRLIHPETGRKAEAEETIARVHPSQFPPMRAATHVHLGMALIVLEQPRRAAEQFQAAVEADPNGKYGIKAAEQLKLCSS